jgi:hypothetical protein
MGNACGPGDIRKEFRVSTPSIILIAALALMVIVVVAVVLAPQGRRRTDALHPQVRSAGMGKNLIDGRDGMELC